MGRRERYMGVHVGVVGGRRIVMRGIWIGMIVSPLRGLYQRCLSRKRQNRQEHRDFGVRRGWVTGGYCSECKHLNDCVAKFKDRDICFEAEKKV
jgi:hypothetical protein